MRYEVLFYKLDVFPECKGHKKTKVGSEKFEEILCYCGKHLNLKLHPQITLFYDCYITIPNKQNSKKS